MYKKSVSTKIIARILTFIIAFTSIPFMPAWAVAEASVIGKTVVDGSVIEYTQSLKENGDNTYTFTVEAALSFAKVDKNVNQAVSKNGYFTAAQSGAYLVELWGGDGANGQNTTYNAGGTGGQGGHIYGTVHLNVGETLYWQLGGDGIPASDVEKGGGANGNGGGHGDIGSYSIGGGGYPYHHVFEKKQLSLKSYDELWEKYLREQRDPSAALRLAYMRLRWPTGLEPFAEEQYTAYLRQNAEAALLWQLSQKDGFGLLLLLDALQPDERVIHLACEQARKDGNTEALALLLLEKQSREKPRGLERDFDL